MINKLAVSKETGLIESARFILSPNYDNRPEGAVIDLIVIHNISLPPGQFSGDAITQFFTNTLDCKAHPSYQTLGLKNLTVSAHVLIRRDGEIIQYVPLHLRAWHAGQSRFKERSNCNDFAIGIELEGTDELPYTDTQYTQLHKLVRALQMTYPTITSDRIVGHCDIAPGRKTDPGPSFDWEKLKEAITL